MWNLDRLYWWTYTQGSNGDADIEKKLVNSGGEGEGGKNWESSIETYPLSYLKWLRELKSSALWQPRGLGWGGGGMGGSRRREHMYTYGQFMLMYGRNQHNIVKQLSSNWKKLS